MAGAVLTSDLWGVKTGFPSFGTLSSSEFCYREDYSYFSTRIHSDIHLIL